MTGGAETGHSPELDLRESRILHQNDLIPDRDGAAYSLRPCLGASRQFCRQFVFEHNVGELDPSTGLEHPV
jgi:hypothetical protein